MGGVFAPPSVASTAAIAVAVAAAGVKERTAASLALAMTGVFITDRLG